MKINVKPLSVNEAWQGRRFKTKEYTAYERLVYYSLPSYTIPDGKLAITIIFGLSNSAGDWDNPIKPFLDILQKKYNFNDNRIYEAHIIKQIVKKGKEFIQFEITQYEL